jgi:Protein of unknown function (DUF4199)
MKKIVLTFGLISGAIMVAMMYATMPFHERIGFDKGLIIGYTTMVLAFMLVFFGIRSYRENVNQGHISWGRAFAVGILITVVACICYVVAWQPLYYKFMPDYLDKYSAYAVEKAKAAGATQQAIDAQVKEMKDFKQMYDNPFFNAAITFTEPFPVGLLVTVISATILRRKKGAASEAKAAES